MSPRLAFAVEAAYLAGRSTLAHFRAGAEVERKADQSPVTVADRLAERMIRERIGARFPEEAILGEEEGGAASQDRWVIDPIDGTKSFISGVPLYSTLVSYEEAGEPIVAACYFPALDEMLAAEKGQGATWNGRLCRVSQKGVLTDAVLSCGGHGSMARYGRADTMNRLAAEALATRTWSDAYGHALVATGQIEAMIDPVVSRWDISAMILIVQEAGGICTNLSGGSALEPVHANGDYELLSANPAMHAQLVEAFA